jgi:hypothetical protein
VAIPSFLGHHVTEPAGAVGCFFWSTSERRSFMTISLVQLQPIIALLAGILILLVPRLLNYIVAIYLIVVGVTGLMR